MTFQVEITPIAEKQIEQAYRWYRKRNPEFADTWFRGLMNAIATLQDKPQRCALAVEHEIFLNKFVNCFMVNLKIFTECCLQSEKI
ncbi:type II toxin-antitoxin system RelE/ParE family toxin [Anabaena azotica]|uniref:type II toxin-antitoxin system RelE/ParE family toxin n=1 Tax=Anabaena azotica TaxID=197653 RepID=UPI0039A5D3EB